MKNPDPIVDKANPTLLWIDYETTGLHAPGGCSGDDVLEIAAYVSKLNDPFRVRAVVNMVFKFSIREFQENNHEIDPFVVDMHTKNGLWTACANSTKTHDDARALLLPHVPELEHSDRTILAGSCPGFDRKFLPAEIERNLSHRVYDVSAIKLFCLSLGMPKIPRADAHRAQADILESITHAHKCVKWFTSNASDGFMSKSIPMLDIHGGIGR